MDNKSHSGNIAFKKDDSNSNKVYVTLNDSTLCSFNLKETIEFLKQLKSDRKIPRKEEKSIIIKFVKILNKRQSGLGVITMTPRDKVKRSQLIALLERHTKELGNTDFGKMITAILRYYNAVGVNSIKQQNIGTVNFCNAGHDYISGELGVSLGDVIDGEIDYRKKLESLKQWILNYNPVNSGHKTDYLSLCEKLKLKPSKEVLDAINDWL